MQCVILAAGKGTRMRPLTENKPKPLVEVDDMPLIEHIVGALPERITELVVVVGYEGDQIREYCGEEFYGRSVKYVEQNKKKGTAHALFQCKDHVGEHFLLVNADDLLGTEALEKALEHDLAMLSYRHEYPERFGVIACDEDGCVVDIIEKPENPPSDQVSTGAMKLDARVFSYDLPEEKDNEHYLSDLVQTMAQDHSIVVIEDSHWHPVGYPEDIPKAEAFLKEKREG